MDPRKLMERLKGAAALTEQDVGEFSHFKGKMMKISVHNYAVEDWGSLSLLESRGMAGLMRRDMLVINSCVKDIPVLVIQYMGLFGRRMLQVHVLDVMKDKTAAGRFASLGRLAEQSGTAVQETPVEWYTPIQLPGSVTVTGKSGQVSLVKLHKANWPISIVLIVFTAFFAIMPLISFALESVIRQPGNYSPSNMTLHFWIGTEDSAYETGMIAGILLNTTMWSALLRQVLLALVVSAIVGTCGMLIGYACVRRRGSRLSRMVESLAFFPYLMPAMAFATIYLAVATSANFKFLYGTFGVLVLVASIKFLPFASRSGVNSMMQIAPEIEEAAVIFGVPWRTRMTRILFPIQKSSIISGYLLPVISVMREVALFTLLVPYARYLLTTMLFSFNETGYAQYGSAVTLLIILIIILINFVTNKLTGASFDKGIGG